MAGLKEEDIPSYEQEFVTSFLRLTKNAMSQDEAIKLAEKTVRELDWTHPVLYHMGFGSIARRILKKEGYKFYYPEHVFIKKASL